MVVSPPIRKRTLTVTLILNNRGKFRKFKTADDHRFSKSKKIGKSKTENEHFSGLCVFNKKKNNKKNGTQ